MSETPLINLSHLEEYTDGDPEMMQELIDVFFETVDETLSTLEHNVTEGENEAWSEAAHKLKGAAGYVGAEKLRSYCNIAQQMRNVPQCERQTMFQNIHEHAARVCDTLKKEFTK